MLQRIEIRAREKIDEFAEMLDTHGHKIAFQRKLADHQREIRNQKKAERQAYAKERE